MDDLETQLRQTVKHLDAAILLLNDIRTQVSPDDLRHKLAESLMGVRDGRHVLIEMRPDLDEFEGA